MSHTKLDISAWNLGVPLAVLTACGPVVPIDDTNSHGETDTIGTTENTTVDPLECRTAADCPPSDYGSNCIDGQCIPIDGYYCGEYGCCDDGCCYGECGWYPECYVDEDCGPGNICYLNYCQPAPAPVECDGVVLAAPIPILEGEEEILSFTFVEALPAPGRELALTTATGITVVASDGSTSSVATTNVVQLASADLDADGDEDLVVNVVGDVRSVRSLLADGAGGFVEISSIDISAVAIALGDVDLDGFADLLTAPAGVLYLHHGLGNGSFDPPQEIIFGEFGALVTVPRSVGSGADLLLYSPDVVAFAPALSGLQPQPLDPMVTLVNAGGLVAGDYDGDALADASAIDSGAGQASIHTWQGIAASANASAWSPGPDYTLLASGDLDADGRDDLAHAATSGELAVRFGRDPAGETDPLGCYALGSLAESPIRVVIDDFDGDGRGDVIAAAGSALWRTRLQ